HGPTEVLSFACDDARKELEPQTVKQRIETVIDVGIDHDDESSSSSHISKQGLRLLGQKRLSGSNDCYERCSSRDLVCEPLGNAQLLNLEIRAAEGFLELVGALSRFDIRSPRGGMFLVSDDEVKNSANAHKLCKGFLKPTVEGPKTRPSLF